MFLAPRTTTCFVAHRGCVSRALCPTSFASTARPTLRTFHIACGAISTYKHVIQVRRSLPRARILARRRRRCRSRRSRYRRRRGRRSRRRRRRSLCAWARPACTRTLIASAAIIVATSTSLLVTHRRITVRALPSATPVHATSPAFRFRVAARAVTTNQLRRMSRALAPGTKTWRRPRCRLRRPRCRLRLRSGICREPALLVRLV